MGISVRVAFATLRAAAAQSSHVAPGGGSSTCARFKSVTFTKAPLSVTAPAMP